MELYNTFSNKKERLAPLSDRPLRLFVCGPTVYDAMHIGHARTYLVFDAFTRYLRSQGVRVEYLQNITDIDDKIIARAHELKLTPRALARKFERLYHRDEARLGIASVTAYARATDAIPFIIDQVMRLREKGCAYEIPNEGYYFDITTFPRYGMLAKRTVFQAEDSLSRIDESIQKRNKGDFVLWKFTQSKFPRGLTQINTQTHTDKKSKLRMKLINGEPAWDTPLGWGRPGWHIEDTAITEHYFGPQYDIHGGAIDLLFPHHEAEIAQQESLSGTTPLARIWMHTGFLLVRGQKMSKSLKNFITIDDFLTRSRASVLRFLILSHHYRSPIDYSDALVSQAAQSLNTFTEFLEKLAFVSDRASNPPTHETNVPPSLAAYEARFTEAMDDDFNTPQALATLFACIHAFQTRVWLLSRNETTALHNFLSQKLALLGIVPVIHKIPASLHRLLTQREQSRASTQFVRADSLRKKIEGLGYIVEDTPLGQFARRISK